MSDSPFDPNVIEESEDDGTSPESGIYLPDGIDEPEQEDDE
jgi:hypothetical protein